jgi:hypothetical protein
MTNESEPLPVDEQDVGLPLQFILAIMLSQGLAEIRIPKKMMDQAMDKVFKAWREENGDFVVQLQR